MKKIICILFCLIIANIIFASGTKDIPEWGTPESMYQRVEKELGHDMEKYERNIVDTTYLYFYNKCNGDWTPENWEVAVSKAVEMCKNNVAIVASKTGVFGEKLLQTLAVTTEDAVSGFNKWIDEGSERYREKHNPY